MLRSAQPYPLRAKLPGLTGVFRGVGVCPDPESPYLVRPLHENGKVTGELGLDGRHLIEHDLTGTAVEGDDVALLDHRPVYGELFTLVVDLDVAGAGNTAPPHTSRHHCRMGCHAPSCRKNPLRGVHAVNILRRGLLSYQDDLEPQFCRLLRIVGGEDNLTVRGARRCGETLRKDISLGLGIKHGMEQLIKLSRIDPFHRLFFIYQPLLHHVNGNLHRGGGCSLAASRLEHPELALLYGKLNILHILVVELKFFVDINQFIVSLGH